MKYLEIRSKETIPDASKTLYEKNDTLRQFRENLDLICKWYNKIRTTTLDIEMPLILGQLDEIDKQLEEGSIAFDKLEIFCLKEISFFLVIK